jgi:hypothetical protein
MGRSRPQSIPWSPSMETAQAVPKRNQYGQSSSSLPGALPDQITTTVHHRHRARGRRRSLPFSGDPAYAETPARASHPWVSHAAKFGSSAIRTSAARVLARWIRSGATWGGSSSKRSHRWWWCCPHRSPRPPAVRTASASSTCSPRSRSSKKSTVTGLPMLGFRWPCAVFCSLLVCFGYVIFSWKVLSLCPLLSSARADGERGALQAANV